jgi:hypothetical protein
MPTVYSQPKLIIGEGKADKVFFEQIFQAHNLLNFQAVFPELGPDGRGGAANFGAYLIGLRLNQGFTANVKKIVLVGDNDDANSFDKMCSQLRDAGYAVPAAPKLFVSTSGKADIAILMIPDAPPGCLETLCYTAAASKWPALVGPLADYFNATPAVGWSSTKQDKMKVQCLLASTCEKNPGVALQDHWYKKPPYHIPVTDPAFQGVVQFLAVV